MMLVGVLVMVLVGVVLMLLVGAMVGVVLVLSKDLVGGGGIYPRGG